MCPEMRLREGPRVMGDYRLTRDDVSVGQEFPDVIGKSHFKAGAHHTVDKNTIAQVEKVCPNDDGSYDIPYRCLVPKTVENLLVAGKCVSTDRDAYLRYLHQTMVTGQAAGVAAACAPATACRPGSWRRTSANCRRSSRSRARSWTAPPEIAHTDHLLRIRAPAAHATIEDSPLSSHLNIRKGR